MTTTTETTGITHEVVLPAKMRQAVVRKAVAWAKQTEKAYIEHLKKASREFADGISLPARNRPDEYAAAMRAASYTAMVENGNLAKAALEPLIDECIAHMQSQLEGQHADEFREWVDLNFHGHALNAPIKFLDALDSAFLDPNRRTDIAPTVEAFTEAVKAEVDNFAKFTMRRQ